MENLKGKHIWVIYQSAEKGKILIREAICVWNNVHKRELDGEVAFSFIGDDKVICQTYLENYPSYWRSFDATFPYYAVCLTEEEAKSFYNEIPLKSFKIKKWGKTYRFGHRIYYVLGKENCKSYVPVKVWITRLLGDNFEVSNGAVIKSENDIFTNKKKASEAAKIKTESFYKKRVEQFTKFLVEKQINFPISEFEVGHKYSTYEHNTWTPSLTFTAQTVSDDKKMCLDENGNAWFVCGHGKEFYEDGKLPTSFQIRKEYNDIKNEIENLEESMKNKDWAK